MFFLIGLFIFYGFITAVLIAQLITSGVKWVNDEPDVFNPIHGTERIVKWVCKNTDAPGNGICKAYFMAYILGGSLALVWMIALPIILVWVGLFGLRGFIRLKKKVNAVCDQTPGADIKAESAG